MKGERSAAPLGPSGYGQLLRENAPFRRFFSARLISLFGDWFGVLAVLALLRELGGADASSFGFVLIAKLLPSLFVAPIGGVIVDRFDRKRLLVVMDLTRAAIVLCLLALPVLSAAVEHLGVRPVWVLYLLVVLQAACIPISEPARNAVLPDLVSEDDLLTANALGAAAWSLMFTIGVAAGGLATAYLGWRSALAIDLASFVLSAGLIATTAIKDHRAGRSEDDAGDSSFREGLRFLAARPRLWTLTLSKAGWSLAGGITLVLTVLGERVYTVGDKAILGVSALYIARGIGTGLGPVVARELAKGDPNRIERLIGVSFFWAALCYGALGFAPSVWVAIPLVILAHLGGATVWVFSTVRIQALTPTAIRGRVFAAEQGIWTLVNSGSILLFGAAIDREWLPLTQVTSGLGVALGVAALGWLVRTLWLGDPRDDEPDGRQGAPEDGGQDDEQEKALKSQATC